jgi:hypothetical protein
MRAHDALLGSPDSVTGMVSIDFDALKTDTNHRPFVCKVGGHLLIHSELSVQAVGCPDSETGLCELDGMETEDHSLGAWDF